MNKDTTKKKYSILDISKHQMLLTHIGNASNSVFTEFSGVLTPRVTISFNGITHCFYLYRCWDKDDNSHLFLADPNVRLDFSSIIDIAEGLEDEDEDGTFNKYEFVEAFQSKYKYVNIGMSYPLPMLWTMGYSDGIDPASINARNDFFIRGNRLYSCTDNGQFSELVKIVTSDSYEKHLEFYIFLTERELEYLNRGVDDGDANWNVPRLKALLANHTIPAGEEWAKDMLGLLSEPTLRFKVEDLYIINAVPGLYAKYL